MMRILPTSLALMLATTAFAETPTATPPAQSQPAPTSSAAPTPPGVSKPTAAPASPQAATPLPPPSPAPVTECDTLSGMPLAQDIRTPDEPGPVYAKGKTREEIGAIVAACRKAAADHPQEKRFAFRLGLALLDAGDEKGALAAFEAAAKLGSIGGLDEASALMVTGNAVRNVEAGLKMRREAIARTGNPELKRGLAMQLRTLRGYKDAEALQILGELAKARYPLGMVELAEDYMVGEVKTASREDGLALMRQASDLGSASAARRLGGAYQVKDFGVYDPAKAAEFFKLAADRGNAPAANNLGVIYENGDGVPRDGAKARALYEKAALRGDPSAQSNLGRDLMEGRNGPADQAQARRWFDLAIEHGDGGAMTDIGMMYDHGRGVPQDMAEARRLYEKAAALGDAGAMNNMGYLFEHGRAATVDYTLARQWYEKAMAGGSSDAFNNMAGMLQQGLGGEKDEKRALTLLERSAEMGNAKGTNNLATAYLRGTGVDIDETKARELYIKAVDLGSIEAVHNLAGMMENAQGGDRNYDEARRLFKRAADTGLPNSMYRYAMRVWYDEADDGRNAAATAEARRWLENAVAAGDPYGFSTLARLTSCGLGGEADPAKGVALYERGVTVNDQSVQDYADALRSGACIPKDAARARRFYTALLAGGSMRPRQDIALALLGMLDNGEGGPKDEAGATALLRGLADEGVAPAKVEYAMRLALGKGVRRDQKRARALLAASVAEGSTYALRPLAVLYDRGIGGPPDLATAAALYRTAAEKGDVKSLSKFAEFARTGRGIKRDPALARRMLEENAADLPADGRLTLARIYDRGEGGPAAPDKAATLLLQNIDTDRDPASLKLVLDGGKTLSVATRRKIADLLRARGLPIPPNATSLPPRARAALRAAAAGGKP